MTLHDGTVGEQYIIKEINLGEGVMRRLRILGMTNNSAVRIINRKFGGAVIVGIRGTRLAIGRDFAKGITVGGVKNER